MGRINTAGEVATVGVTEMVGEIVMWMTPTPPADHMVADGSQFDPLVYPELAAILGGDTLPDLTDQFVGGASAAHAPLTAQPFQTGKPKTSHVSNRAGSHTHSTTRQGHHEHRGSYKRKNQGGGNQVAVLPDWNGQYWGQTNWRGDSMVIHDGAHDHGRVASAGGAHEHRNVNNTWDAETAPKHAFLYYIIRVR